MVQVMLRYRAEKKSFCCIREGTVGWHFGCEDELHGTRGGCALLWFAANDVATGFVWHWKLCVKKFMICSEPLIALRLSSSSQSHTHGGAGSALGALHEVR